MTWCGAFAEIESLDRRARVFRCGCGLVAGSIVAEEFAVNDTALLTAKMKNLEESLKAMHEAVPDDGTR